MTRNDVAVLASLLLVACSAGDPPIAAVGTLERDRAELRAPAAEQVVERPATDGAVVARGDVLVQLDTAAAQARLARLRAEAKRARAQLAELRRGTRQERIDQVRANLEAARITRDQARTELRRQQRLEAQGQVSKQALDGAREAWQVAEARVRQLDAELREHLNGATVEQLDQAAAALEAAEAAMAEQTVRLNELTVTAPYNGSVEQVLVEPGDRPGIGALLVTQYRAGPPYARVFLPASVKQRAAPGDAFAVMVEGRGCYPARLRYIAGEATFTPYFALRESERGRLVYVAELQLGDAAADLPTGHPVSVLERADCEGL